MNEIVHREVYCDHFGILAVQQGRSKVVNVFVLYLPTRYAICVKASAGSVPVLVEEAKEIVVDPLLRGYERAFSLRPQTLSQFLSDYAAVQAMGSTFTPEDVADRDAAWAAWDTHEAD